jgi:hypothetical protein
MVMYLLLTHTYRSSRLFSRRIFSLTFQRPPNVKLSLQRRVGGITILDKFTGKAQAAIRRAPIGAVGSSGCWPPLGPAFYDPVLILLRISFPVSSGDFPLDQVAISIPWKGFLQLCLYPRDMGQSGQTLIQRNTLHGTRLRCGG